jgi:hypothetical protein
MLTDEQLMNRGAEAEQSRDYIVTVIDHAKDMILDLIMNLSPDETMKFSILKSEILGINELLSIVEADINEGRAAIQRIQGTTPLGNGIL